MRIWLFCVLVFTANASTAWSEDLRAQLSPREFTTLAAEIGAKVEEITVKDGERFTKGDLLVRFDCLLHQARVDETRAHFVAAEKTVKVNERLLELQAVGGLEYDLALAERARAAAQVAASKAMLSKCSISAPFSGRVVEQKVRAQQFVQPGQELLDILDDSILELDFLVPSKWLIWLRSGQVFEVTIEETEKSYPVTLIRLGARVDPVSQSVRVTGAVGGRFPELVAGMSGIVNLTPP